MATDYVCPVCSTALVAGAAKCGACGMEVSRMADYRLAKAAAAQKQRGEASVLAARERHWHRKMVYLVLLVALGFGLTFLIPRSGSEPWRALPLTPEDAVRTYLTLIARDDTSAHRQAYAMVNPAAKDKDNKREPDLYLQFYHDIHRYLSSEFGNDWASTATLRAEKGKPVTVRVGTAEVGETLHVELEDLAPSPKRADGLHGYAINAITEFNVNSAARSNQLEGALGGMRMLGAGSGAADVIRGISGTQGNYARETAMETKMRLLPQIRNPRSEFIDHAVLQLWKVRDDPLVRARLREIGADERYAPVTRQRAKSVLDGTASEEELNAAKAI